MYVPPRPDRSEDPRFALRLGLITVLAFVAIDRLNPAQPSLCAALPIVLGAGQRGAFSPLRVFGAAIVLAILVWLLAGLIDATRHVPLAMMTVMYVVFFFGFYLTRQTASPMGMMILSASVMLSVIGMKSPQLLPNFRDGLFTACAIAPLAITLAYIVFPPKTRDKHVQKRRPMTEHQAEGAIIRAGVLLALSLWLYAVLSTRDMILGIIAVFPLVFPTRVEAFAEAAERIWATILGGAASVLILIALQFSAHFAVQYWLLFMLGWICGEGMIQGRHSAGVYQYALSVAAVLVILSLTRYDPGVAITTRVGLTFLGSAFAALAVAVLDKLFLPPSAEKDDFSPHPAVQRRRFGKEIGPAP